MAFVGAGGKSSAILQAAGELAEAGVPVLVTSTTKMLVSEAEKVGPVLISEDREELRSKVAETLAGQGAAVAGSGILSKKRVDGVEPSWVPDLAPKDGVTLVEADGSRRRPLKGTASHEPPSLTEPPSWSSLAASAPSASPYTKNVSTARKSSRSSPALVRVTPSTPAHSPGPYSPDSTTPPPTPAGRRSSPVSSQAGACQTPRWSRTGSGAQACARWSLAPSPTRRRAGSGHSDLTAVSSQLSPISKKPPTRLPATAQSAV